MNEKSLAASMLGKLGRGVKKTITNADRKSRKKRLEEARKKRWLKK